MKKRILTLVLSLALLCALFPVAGAFSTGNIGEHTTISAGQDCTAFIDTDGNLWTWGSNNGGQLGDGTAIDHDTPFKVMNNVSSVNMWHTHTAAIKTDGSLWNWGTNSFDGLEYSAPTNYSTSAKMLNNVAAVATGDMYRAAAVRTDGTLWVWGDNRKGQLGDGTTTSHYAPVMVMEDVVSISMSRYDTAAIKSDGTLWTWGENSIGQLGDGTTTDRYVPVKVMDDVVAVDIGSGWSAVIKSDGTLWTWYHANYGQLGNGDIATPVEVMDDVIAVSSGGNHIAAIRKDSTLWTWGSNTFGQLGDGTTTDHDTPVKVMDHVAAVSAGGTHTVAIKNDGTLWVWGRNDDGQLGTGGVTNTRDKAGIPIQTVPYQLTGLKAALPTRLNLSGGLGITTTWTPEGNTLTPPTNPTKAGYSFAGWYTDEALTKPWNFDTGKATVGLVLYAKWVPISSSSETADKGTTPVTLDGKMVTISTYVLKDEKGNEINYVKLRDIAALLDGTDAQCNVDWKNGAIRVTTGAPYTTRNGTELTDVIAGAKNYKVNTAPVIIDGYTKPLEGIVLTDAKGGGHTLPPDFLRAN